MITPEEFLKINGDDKESNFKLATVDPAYTTGLIKLIFDGESAVSEKGYMFLSSYEPAPNDRVLLIKVADTYIVMDKIVTEKTATSATAQYTDVTVTNKVTTKDLQATGATTLAGVTTSGNLVVNGASATVKTLNVSGPADLDSTLNVYSTATFNSSVKIGGAVGFYNANPIAKQTAYKPNSQADLATVRTRLDELITKLGNLGLFTTSY
jgi:hypothetical protein